MIMVTCVSTVESRPRSAVRRMRPVLYLLATIGIGATSVGCLYGALTAIIDPSRLPLPILGLRGWPRTDTSALVSFATSTLLVFAVRLSMLSDAEDPWPSLRRHISAGWVPVADAASLTILMHGSAGAIYVGANYFIHPETLGLPLTHFAPWPTEWQFGLGAAIAAGQAARFRRSIASGGRRRL
jgi:hypothetical protein